jgi:cytochrome oxidase Cu insertion factor (SCO1/SenC/PrrC family)
MSQTKQANNKKSLILVAVAFILPVVLAKIALDTEFFNRGATNKGELIDPVIDLAPAFSQKDPKWRLVYVMPSDCDQVCENTIFTLQQVHLSLGKHIERVEPVVISTHSESKDLINKHFWEGVYARFEAVEGPHTLEVLTLEEKIVNDMFKNVALDGIFVVDTLNNGMLRHPTHANEAAAVEGSRALLSDVKKLLKLSRIG